MSGCNAGQSPSVGASGVFFLSFLHILHDVVREDLEQVLPGIHLKGELLNKGGDLVHLEERKEKSVSDGREEKKKNENKKEGKLTGTLI